MRIIYVKLENFIGVHAAMGIHTLELEFDRIDKPIIQIYGKNRCGKTVLIQQLHPFSSINLSGDERSDLSLIIPGKIGIKNIVYDVNGEVYNITHTYRPTNSGHSISSSILHNGKELNPSGGVTIFNNLIEKILGINKYIFQFIINGTQLTSFANMSVTQRKNLLNKAMGIDIYAKMHKLATDDYRYVSKLISSLNNTKEFLLSTYGSYENLCTMLNQKQVEHDTLQRELENIKSTIDNLIGMIQALKQQNILQELTETNRLLAAYENVVQEIGSADAETYTRLVNEQIQINQSLSDKKNQRIIIMKDKDALYKQKNDIEMTMMERKRAKQDLDNMISMQEELTNKIKSLEIKKNISASSDHYRSLISLAQAINDICTEITTCLNDHHMKLFVEMILNGIDISAFILQEGSVLMDSEKEKSVMSRIRSMINTIDGQEYQCDHKDCIHWRIHEMLDNYFKSYQSTTNSKFTQYDMEQFDHAYKNLQTIKRLLRVDIADELKNDFHIDTIMVNLLNHHMGIDTDNVKEYMEEAAKIEQRNRYIEQLSGIEYTINNMKKMVSNTNDSPEETILDLQSRIDKLIQEMEIATNEINELSTKLVENDRYRMLVSQVQHINISEKIKQKQKLESLQSQLEHAEYEYSQLQTEYASKSNQMNIIKVELKTLTDANTQYQNTVTEIDKYLIDDRKFKVIAEATSSTKGKPVIAIRDKVGEAIMMTNRLLDVMYDGEIELLNPTIDETTFVLPFRCGTHESNDIRYGSQSESTLLSLALSLSLASSLTKYDVCLLDELDAYLDAHMRDSFLLMLQEIMATLRMEQMFLISHSILPDQYEHIVHAINLSDEIEKMKE
jgi:DNA repair exonuclease SbcCD ATPase subunit